MAISKMIFVNWSPDQAPIKGRVLYATAKESFKKYLDLNTKDFTLSSKGDVNIDFNVVYSKRCYQGTWTLRMRKNDLIGFLCIYFEEIFVLCFHSKVIHL